MANPAAVQPAMRAIVKVPFCGVRDGEFYPVDWQRGDTVEGSLAEVAIREGWAVPEGRTDQSAPENQALGGAPEVATFPAAPEQAVRRRGRRPKPNG